ncbi:MAG TPA: hypothetical protein VMM78_12855 [Thermomicrobiales bacterium]|nr:hypothetical protein [Thermomicrobiales bacterium]
MKEPRLKGQEAIVARYGTRRSFILRLLYSWLTMTMLFSFPWPLAVLIAEAPGGSPWTTPLDWFQVRFLPPALIASIAAWLWTLSPVPSDIIRRERLLAPFHSGRVWPQVMVFLLGMIALTAILLLVENTGGALKLILLTAAEAAVIMILISGYMHAAFDTLLEEYRSIAATLPVLLLYALTFGMRGGLATASEEVLAGDQFVVAMSAGIVAGVIIGAIAVFLRHRSGSLLPGFLALWLVLLLLPLNDFYGG